MQLQVQLSSPGTCVPALRTQDLPRFLHFQQLPTHQFYTPEVTIKPVPRVPLQDYPLAQCFDWRPGIYRRFA